MDRRQPSPSKFPRFALGLVLLCGASGAWAQSNADANKKLHDVEQKIQIHEQESARQKARADALKAELNALTAELVTAAKRVQDQEAEVAALEGEMARLQRQADMRENDLRERRKQFSSVAMALTRIARFPTEALVAQPIPPDDTVRSAILLRAAVPAIESRADALKDELADLAFARAEVEGQRKNLAGALERLRAEEGSLEVVRKRKAALRAEAISKGRAAQSQARRLGREARDLRDLVAKLDQQRIAAARAATQAQKTPAQLHVKPKPGGPAQLTPNAAPATQSAPVDVSGLSGIGSISKARGRLPFPAVGRLVGLYGQQLDGGLTRKGVSLETRTGAQVIAPFDGQVVFAGPFRAYGQLLIIDHGEGYHSLLAGLGHIDAVIGQPVLAGEPVALMTQDTRQPVLYVEFRRNNEPINPLPWLAARKGTPKG